MSKLQRKEEDDIASKYTTTKKPATPQPTSPKSPVTSGKKKKYVM